jgi:hypothetical protein
MPKPRRRAALEATNVITMEEAIEIASLLVEKEPWRRSEGSIAWRWTTSTAQDILLSVDIDKFDRAAKVIRARVTVTGSCCCEIDAAHEFSEVLREATAKGNLIRDALATYTIPLPY